MGEQIRLKMRNFIILIFPFFLYISCERNTQFLKATQSFDYPSGSGIEYFQKHFYIIGDDATKLLQLDSNLAITDSIPLFASNSIRMPKESKPDMEAITVVSWQKKPYLLLTGSGSLSPYRNKAILFDLQTKIKSVLGLDTFYRRLLYQGLKEINIEGICAVPGSIVLSNRGHKANPKNYLVLVSPGFWNWQSSSPIRLIKVGTNDDMSNFKGVSGLAYANQCDKLILTVSTEDTRSVYEDGTIGKSYLWIIDNFSSKKRWNTINPNRVIDLELADPRFKGNKIESACVIRQTKHFLQLALVADNDKGNTTVFRLDVSRK